MQGFEKASKMQDKLIYKLDKEREVVKAVKSEAPTEQATNDRVRVFRSEQFKRDHGDRT